MHTPIQIPVLKISAPVRRKEQKRKKKKTVDGFWGGRCEVIYHGCGWRMADGEAGEEGGKESSPGTPPVAAVILSRSRLV